MKVFIWKMLFEHEVIYLFVIVGVDGLRAFDGMLLKGFNVFFFSEKKQPIFVNSENFGG